MLYVLPGASSLLSSIHYGGGGDHDLLMVLYVGGSARLWDSLLNLTPNMR